MELPVQPDPQALPDRKAFRVILDPQALPDRKAFRVILDPPALPGRKAFRVIPDPQALPERKAFKVILGRRALRDRRGRRDCKAFRVILVRRDQRGIVTRHSSIRLVQWPSALLQHRPSLSTQSLFLRVHTYSPPRRPSPKPGEPRQK